MTEAVATIVILRRGDSKIGSAMHKPGKGRLYLRQPRLALERQNDSASPSIEQLRTKSQLQISNALADGSLSKPKLLCCGSKVAQPRCGFENPDPFVRRQGITLQSHK
jgi:hypothetical protein